MTDSTNRQVVLPGSHRIQAPGAVALRQTDPNATMEVTVKLRRKAPLPDINPQHPQILSPEELEGQYGTSQDDMDLAGKAFAAYGLTVTGTDRAARSLCLSGPVSAVEQAFGTKLFDVKTDEGEHRGRSGDIHIPAELAGLIEGVFGLDERRVVRPRRAPLIAEARARQQQVGLFASQLAVLYHFPPGDGSGQTIGLLEFGGGYFPTDLAKFSKLAGLSGVNVQPISVDNTATNLKDGQEGEVMLDIEIAASACPKATITVYFSNFDEQGWIDALDRALQDLPTVISVSWGLAEDDPQWSQGAIQAISDAMQRAALLGITVCIASGDDGSGDQVTDGLAHADFPSVSPYVLSVGGTQFTLSGNQISNEVVWKQGDGKRADGGGSTGGGVSQKFPRPAWQTVSIASVNPRPLDGRVFPDIAALAGLPGYSVVIDGKSGANGGTSAATPLWAALICRLIANLPAGKKLPFLPPLLYQTAGGTTLGTAGCNDITSGDNITATVGGYQAGPGYDAVSGWGTPDGGKLLAALVPLLA